MYGVSFCEETVRISLHKGEKSSVEFGDVNKCVWTGDTRGLCPPQNRFCSGPFAFESSGLESIFSESSIIVRLWAQELKATCCA